MTVLLAIVLLADRGAVLAPLLGSLTDWTAGATFAALDRLGIDATRDATILYQPDGFAYQIYHRCTGFLPAAFLTAVILISPGNWRRKLIGLAVGVPLIVALNLARLVHLFTLGVARPELFDLAHGVLWEGVMMVAVVGLWQAWDRLANRHAVAPA